MPSIKTDGLHSINSHAEAVARYQKSKPWKGFDAYTERRPIAQSIRAKKHMSVRHNSVDDTVAFRLYDTDVVIFHPDDSITIDLSYSSKSTAAFAYALLPGGVTVSCFDEWPNIVGLKTADGSYAWRDGRVYQVDRSGMLRIRPDGHGLWELHPECAPQPFRFYTVDRPAAKEAMALYPQAKEFANFVKAAQALRSVRAKEKRRKAYEATPYQASQIKSRILNIVQGGHDAWMEVVNNEYYARLTAASILGQVREAVYREHNVMTPDERPYVSGYSGVQAAHASEKKWGW